MATQPVDYTALAKQFGATSSTPDYSALAKQFGAVGSTPAPDKPQSVPGMPGGQPPGPAKPPLPSQLASGISLDPGQPKQDSRVLTDVGTGRPISRQMPGFGAPSEMMQGIEQIAGAGVRTPKETDPRSTGQRAVGGLNRIVSAGMQAAAPVALPGAAVTYGAAATGLGLLTGGAAQQGVEHGLNVAGVPPEYSEAAGTVAGLAAGTALGPKVANALPDSLLPRRNPKTAMIQALKPTATNTKFGSALDRAMPEIKASEAEVGPISQAPQGKALDHMMTAVDAAKKRVWGQYQQMAGPAANAQIDMKPVAEAMIQSIPQKYAMENPTAAAAIMNKAALYRKSMPLQQAEQFLKETNAELQGQYAKYPPDQRRALAANPQIAYREAQADSLRNAIYGYLDQPGGGAAAAELKQRYGALMNLEREGYRRLNVANRQQPDSLSEQLGKWSGYADIARGALTGNPVDVAVGATKRAAAKYIKEQQTTDSLIRSAFKNYTGQPAPIQMPPPFQPKGLLTTGDVIPPAPPDSSFVRSAPAMAQPPNPARALPAGPTVRPAGPITPDASYVRGVPGMAQPPNPARALPPATTRMAPPPGAADIHPSTAPGPLVGPQGPSMMRGVSPAPPVDTSSVRAIPAQYPPKITEGLNRIPNQPPAVPSVQQPLKTPEAVKGEAPEPFTSKTFGDGPPFPYHSNYEVTNVIDAIQHGEAVPPDVLAKYRGNSAVELAINKKAPVAAAPPTVAKNATVPAQQSPAVKVAPKSRADQMAEFYTRRAQKQKKP